MSNKSSYPANEVIKNMLNARHNLHTNPVLSIYTNPSGSLFVELLWYVNALRILTIIVMNSFREISPLAVLNSCYWLLLPLSVCCWFDSKRYACRGGRYTTYATQIRYPLGESQSPNSGPPPLRCVIGLVRSFAACVECGTRFVWVLKSLL